MAIEIQTASPADAKALAPLFDDYRVSQGALSDPEGCLRFVSDRLTNDESCFLAAVRNGDVVGFANLYRRYAPLSLKRNWILGDLYVCPENRRNGIARLLLEASKTLAHESGADALTVATTRDNLAARDLYLSVGFEPIDGLEMFALSPTSNDRTCA